MKNFIYTGFIFLLIAGCKPGIPGDVIQPDKMAMVLHDIHVVDALVTSVSIPDSARATAAAYYNGIYEKYEIDSALYAESMNYYMGNPKALNEVYEMVTANLTNEKNNIIKTDSIANAKLVEAARLSIFRDSTRRADSIYWRSVLLRDTTRIKDTLLKDTLLKVPVKKKIDIIKPRMVYKDLRN